MAVLRDTPYGAFNFLVELNDGSDAATAVGGFSDVSGLGTEITLMDYRQGNDRENRVRKIPGLHKACGRDAEARRHGHRRTSGSGSPTPAAAPRPSATCSITLNDEQGNPVLRWKLINARPMKWTGPTLAGKGGSDVAMEELVLTSEGFEFAD